MWCFLKLQSILASLGLRHFIAAIWIFWRIFSIFVYFYQMFLIRSCPENSILTFNIRTLIYSRNWIVARKLATIFCFLFCYWGYYQRKRVSDQTVIVIWLFPSAEADPDSTVLRVFKPNSETNVSVPKCHEKDVAPCHVGSLRLTHLERGMLLFLN